MRTTATLAFAIVPFFVIAFIACSAAKDHDGAGAGASPGPGPGGAGGGAGGGITLDGGTGGACGDERCSIDRHAVVDCNGKVVTQCSGTQGCDSDTLTCIDACQAADHDKQSVGCDYYPIFMDHLGTFVCFAAFVSNTWDTPAHVDVQWGTHKLPIETFGYVTSGKPPFLKYTPIDPQKGVPPGEVAVLFLSGPKGTAYSDPLEVHAPCPFPSAVLSGASIQQASGVGTAFHLTTDVPVVVSQINPFGGGVAATTGASLLLPTSAWDVNYIAVDAAPFDVAFPSFDIVAKEDATKVTIVPNAAVQGGGGIPSGAANKTMSFTLDKGQYAQLSQKDELTGSVVQADKPIGLLAGHNCMRIPQGVTACDHAEQMIPSIRALGHEYVGVMYRPRATEPAIWRVVGAVDGTKLAWSSDVGGPSALDLGQAEFFITDQPFVVKSQDKDHPFMLFTYMSGADWKQDIGGAGDPDFVVSVPPDQYMSRYVFFADPTYPESNLVVVRSKLGGKFHDVELDCAGKIGGFSAIGDYEWARVDLTTGDFDGVNGCAGGRHEMKSDAPFGLWVWGWGTSKSSEDTTYVSYGYPAGMNVQPINDVVVPPVPK